MLPLHLVSFFVGSGLRLTLFLVAPVGFATAFELLARAERSGSIARPRAWATSSFRPW
jgi:hypothetical protein